MEMLDRAFAARVLARAAGFNPNTLRTLTADFHSVQKLKEFIKTHDTTQGYYIAEGSFRQNPDTIADLVDKLKPDVVYIDASYLVSPRASTKAKWERLSEVGEDIKKIAMEYDIPIFQTVQFNRESEKKKSYSLDNIGGGDFVGQLGSIVLGIQKGEGIHEDDRRKVTIMKNRDGDQGEFEVNFSFNPPNFDEVPQSNYEDQLLDSNLKI